MLPLSRAPVERSAGAGATTVAAREPTSAARRVRHARRRPRAKQRRALQLRREEASKSPSRVPTRPACSPCVRPLASVVSARALRRPMRARACDSYFKSRGELWRHGLGFRAEELFSASRFSSNGRVQMSFEAFRRISKGCGGPANHGTFNGRHLAI